jgi:signal transduction protein with GAF and PtsI domain
MKPAKQKSKVGKMVVLTKLRKKAAPLLKQLEKITSIKTLEDFDRAAVQTKLLKDIGKEVKEEKERVLSSIKTLEADIRGLFAPTEEDIESAERDIKELMDKYLEKKDSEKKRIEQDFKEGKITSIAVFNKKIANTETKSSAASVSNVNEVKIVDKSKIPLQYLEPNMTAIKAALKGGEDVPGVKLSKKRSIRI